MGQKGHMGHRGYVVYVGYGAMRLGAELLLVLVSV
jgi:hypothetical protein